MDSLSLIFANIEQIWQFQQTFLDALRNGIQQNRIAETFIEFVSVKNISERYIKVHSKFILFHFLHSTAISVYGLFDLLQFIFKSFNGIGKFQ